MSLEKKKNVISFWNPTFQKEWESVQDHRQPFVPKWYIQIEYESSHRCRGINTQPCAVVFLADDICEINKTTQTMCRLHFRRRNQIWLCTANDKCEKLFGNLCIWFENPPLFWKNNWVTTFESVLLVSKHLDIKLLISGRTRHRSSKEYLNHVSAYGLINAELSSINLAPSFETQSDDLTWLVFAIFFLLIRRLDLQ